MLTKQLLDFRDIEMQVSYIRKNRKYYARAVMVITAILFAIALIMEIDM